MRQQHKAAAMRQQGSEAATLVLCKVEVCQHSNEAAVTDRPAANLAAHVCSRAARYVHSETIATCFPQ